LLLVLACAGTVSIDKKRVCKYGDAYHAFEARTSILPFGAIIEGRNELHLGELVGWRLGVAVAVFAGVFTFDAKWFGASPL
jgi:uncharacterized membrane protein